MAGTISLVVLFWTCSNLDYDIRYHWKSISRLRTRGRDLVPLICHVYQCARIRVWSVCRHLDLFPSLARAQCRREQNPVRCFGVISNNPRAITIGAATAATATTAIRATTAATATTAIRATTAATATTSIRTITLLQPPQLSEPQQLLQPSQQLLQPPQPSEPLQKFARNDLGTYSSNRLRRLSNEDRLWLLQSIHKKRSMARNVAFNMHGWYNFLGCAILDVFESGLWYHYHWKSISRLRTRGRDLVPLICHTYQCARIRVWSVCCRLDCLAIQGSMEKRANPARRFGVISNNPQSHHHRGAATAATAIRATTAATATTSIRATQLLQPPQPSESQQLLQPPQQLLQPS